MEKEITTILSHHDWNIGQLFRGVVTPEQAKQVASQYADRLAKKRTESGEPVYPGLQTKAGRKRYRDELVALYFARRDQQVTLIPDFEEGGQPNFDVLCQICGNKHGEKCLKPAEYRAPRQADNL